MSNPIHVLLVGMRGILGEIIRTAVAGQPDMVVAGDVHDETEFIAVARHSRCDAVIIREVNRRRLSRGGVDLLTTSRHLTVFIVYDDDRYELQRLLTDRVESQDLSTSALMDVIRHSVSELSSDPGGIRGDKTPLLE